MLDLLKVDPYLWRFRLPPPTDCSFELFFESGLEFAGWRSPSAPKDAEEDIAGIDILVDLGLWSAKSWEAILPTKEVNNPADLTDCAIEPVYYFFRRLPFGLEDRKAKLGRREGCSSVEEVAFVPLNRTRCLRDRTSAS